jgi:transcriptional regulator GlxA family with amidase domain
VVESGIPERSLKRRSATATGSTVIGYVQNNVQNIRIEDAKRLLETGDASFEISPQQLDTNPAFFRKLFRRCTGLTARKLSPHAARIR